MSHLRNSGIMIRSGNRYQVISTIACHCKRKFVWRTSLNIFCLSFLLCLTVLPRISATCSDNPSISLQKKTRSSSLVIRGKVQSVLDNEFSFKVFNVYKGNSAYLSSKPTILVSSGRSNTTLINRIQCMDDLNIDQKYILFLNDSHGVDAYSLLYAAVIATKTTVKYVRQLVLEEPQIIEQQKTVTVATQILPAMASDAAHYGPCSPDIRRHYCMNGGECFQIVSLQLPVCRCSNGFEGPRCRHYTFVGEVSNVGEEYDPMPVIIFAVFFVVILVVFAIGCILYIRYKKKYWRQSSNRDGETAASLESAKIEGQDSNRNTVKMENSEHTRLFSNEDDESRHSLSIITERNTNENHCTTSISTPSSHHSLESTV